ncbi:MAG: gliding motility protein GldL [Flavobacteriaceae bacterium]|nr:gliding motility protein GldL [Flavobacteriaceae bacterium]
MHMLFGLGGAVVIIGALFKILHLEIGPITGGLVLGLGLGTEALIFTVSALNTGEIKEEHDEFVKKLNGSPKSAGTSVEQGLSSKIDEMLKEAKLDVALMNNLTKSIKNLESSAQALTPAADAASSSANYAEQLTDASQKLQQLNQVYAEQVIAAGNNAEFNENVAENAEKLRLQMEALSSNLSALNQVYNGMLSAMNKN